MALTFESLFQDHATCLYDLSVFICTTSMYSAQCWHLWMFPRQCVHASSIFTHHAYAQSADYRLEVGFI